MLEISEVPYFIEGTTVPEICSRDLKIQDIHQFRRQCRVCVLFYLEYAKAILKFLLYV